VTALEAPAVPAHLSPGELQALGFASLGHDVRIDRRAALFGTGSIHIGSHVRIDCFAVITAGPAVVRLGSYTHVAAHTYLSGAQGGIRLGYGAGIAPFAALYSAVEDYTGGHLTNPSVPVDLRRPDVGLIDVAPHAAIGSSSVVLAGIEIGFGSSIGALSLVSRRVRPFEVVHGNPIRRTGRRERAKLLELDAELRARARAAGLELPTHDVLGQVEDRDRDGGQAGAGAGAGG
jgi:galactoside O-acetyltransferase